FSYNSLDRPFLEKALEKIDITGKATTNLTFEKCSIKTAKWSNTPDKLTPVLSVKNGQAVYVYMETINCEGEEITFELYRVKNRLILKDILVSEGTVTKIVPRSGVLAGNFIVYVNSEDGSSSKYKFRVRLSKYLTMTNTTNTTLPPPTTNTTQPPLTTNTTNQTNLTGLPDLIVEKIDFFKHVYQYGYISAVPLGDTMILGEADPYARIRTKNIGSAFDIYPSYPLTTGIITKDGVKLTSFSGSSGGKMNASQSTAFAWGFVSDTVGQYCIEGAKADSENILLESNEINNGISPKCLTITANQTNTTNNTTNMTRLPDLIVESVDWVKEGPNWQCCAETIVITSASVGDKIMGKLTIKNTGTGNVTVGNLFDVKATATKDGIKLISPSGDLRWTVGSLFVGESKSSSPLTLNVSETGRYCIENTKVDYFNIVIELREDNNLFASRCINVGSN
ncbi:hypothetical protein HYX16_01485, partial [Candidatus Woesearchaeota archaeon]|nr:hypothetical protein [Candidatus Woesearchaeota archaeon]